VLQLKDLRGRTVGEKATWRDGKILEELEGPRGARTLVTRTEKNLADLTKPL